MKRRNLFWLVCFYLYCRLVPRVDTLMVKSPSMNKEVQVLVVTLMLLWEKCSLSGTLLVAWVWRSC